MRSLGRVRRSETPSFRFRPRRTSGDAPACAPAGRARTGARSRFRGGNEARVQKRRKRPRRTSSTGRQDPRDSAFRNLTDILLSGRERAKCAPGFAWSGSEKWSPDVRRDLRGADGGDVRRPRPGAEGGGTPVSVDNIVGLVLSAAVAIYLVAALLLPERF